jgi:hypothetical protein
MGRIYDENAIEVGQAMRYPIRGLLLNVNRAPSGDWLIDAGGTDVVTIRAVGGGFVVDPSGKPAERSAFPAAMQLALHRLGF